MGQVLSWDAAKSFLDNQRDNNTIVFTNGCFDILHVGHVKYLQEAKAQGSILVLGLNSDASVKRLKGPSRPVQNEQDRSYILAALECVDVVCVFEEETPLDLIKTILPDVLVKGGDWSKDQIVGSDFVLARGGDVRSLQFVNGRSTTNIVEKIAENETST
ncbi:MAG: D-glycero-beta-D-manno-heptose 1-phosphate adenylyltransferase [Bdellovibrionales bacterium]